MDEVTRSLLVSDMEILTISETWLDDTHSDESIYISGYVSHRHDRTAASNKDSGGEVLIYYKETLKCTPCPELSRCTPNLECAWVKLDLDNNKDVYVCSLYRPPSGRGDRGQLGH